ncbi:MAG TPA: septum formation initiator family protein [Jatrophihabitantaceae bacterium]|nr:septum formation initiator family protein [Jatrophihabitantaceae bacterium]
MGTGGRGGSGRRRGLTGRALVLGAVIIVLVVILAAPLHRYLSSHGAVEQAQQERRENQAQLARLHEQLAQWDDPAYVEQQARTRLQYALPGDTVYVVVHPGEKSGLGGAAQHDTAPVRVPGGTWNQRLWGSVVTADSAP